MSLCNSLSRPPLPSFSLPTHYHHPQAHIEIMISLKIRNSRNNAPIRISIFFDLSENNNNPRLHNYDKRHTLCLIHRPLYSYLPPSFSQLPCCSRHTDTLQVFGNRFEFRVLTTKYTTRTVISLSLYTHSHRIFHCSNRILTLPPLDRDYHPESLPHPEFRHIRT
jgi:hypothetical protein